MFRNPGLDLDCFASLNTGCADLHLNPGAILLNPYCLDVRVLDPLGGIVGVTDGITKHRTLTTYFAYS